MATKAATVTLGVLQPVPASQRITGLHPVFFVLCGVIDVVVVLVLLVVPLPSFYIQRDRG
jgi:hypothetical protein